MAFDGSANSRYMIACKAKLEETRALLAEAEQDLKDAALEQEILNTLNTQRRAELVASGALRNLDIATVTAKRDSLATRRAALRNAVDFLETQVPPPPEPR